jgi:hydrogenase maturation protein HypF
LACPVCGPQLWFRGAGGEIRGIDAALAACIRALQDGLTVAVKGVGGYHLVCDATREASVARLRVAKHRPAKPFAVMVPMAQDDPLRWVHRLAELNPMEASTLHDPVRPIVLVRRRDPTELAPGVAPGLADIGLMLPYSPLHYLLLQAFAKPLVATSANISGEPVLTEGAEVERRLAACCDAYLHHDRPIHRPADDPVLRVMAGRVVPIRLGRGTAPAVLPIPVALNAPVLACGGQMRTTVALGWGNSAVVSPHVGDLGSLRAAKVFESVADGLEQLYGVRPEQTLCDAHPGFSIHAWARRRGRLVTRVHHHHAHASALLGEHGVMSPTLVFAWDGMGLGEDDTLWGGETLYGSPGCWRRLGSFRPLVLVGGDAVSREPWRSAAAVCWDMGIPWGSHRSEAALVRHAWERRINAHQSSAVGRLFDAAAALLGLIDTASYDGQAPAMLEAVTRAPSNHPVPMPITHPQSSMWTVDWGPLMRALIAPLGAGPASVSERADLFHSSLAASVLDQARAARLLVPVGRVGLTGGVFQNRRLTEEAVALLRADGFDVLLHERVPPNDGGLSYGQVVEFAGQQAHRPARVDEQGRVNGA